MFYSHTQSLDEPDETLFGSQDKGQGPVNGRGGGCTLAEQVLLDSLGLEPGEPVFKHKPKPGGPPMELFHCTFYGGFGFTEKTIDTKLKFRDGVVWIDILEDGSFLLKQWLPETGWYEIAKGELLPDHYRRSLEKGGVSG